eukprot:TRINITY_DN59945_c0_g1_i1.p1 TRINITY_DN59945_c0_g1~~TRINITY_DN59945_c0_g1_i1.p1  ORF type:complete len:393 (-),score=20.50 TRINITY_DN59945_c0_g1_i1:93-1229(-)
MEGRALGCMLGAAVGDAAGAVLEWQHPSNITPAVVDSALAFPGAGPHSLAPGQITDDTEQHLCLATGLCNGNGNFSLNKIAREYSRWVTGGQPGNSAVAPFDVGKACGNAFQSCSKFESCYLQPPDCPYGSQCWYRHGGAATDSPPWGNTMTTAARDHNGKTKSNGALMRCMPLAVWGHKLPLEDLVAAVRLECGLSHPSPECVDCECVYVIVAAQLVHGTSVSDSINCGTKWATENACQNVQNWLAEAASDKPLKFRCDTLDDGTPSADSAIAFIRWAFTNAFRQLFRNHTWVEALRETLHGGGDTDTNAAIAAGLVGARWGAENIPEPMKAAVLQCDTAKNLADPGTPRPAFLHPRAIPELCRRLLELAPGHLQVV